MQQMLIANRLASGRTVFRAADGSWVEEIAGGLLIGDADDAERLLAASHDDATRNIVIDPGLITVAEHNGVRIPAEIREAIRAAGPTIEVES